jgi:5-oxoprolinase (ATP-hydrolysing) subunit A
MADTGTVDAVDLNADLAEGEVLTAGDRAVLRLVTSANLACGFHAGNRAVMREAAEVCRDRGIAVGAHVSYRDREGFGRRPVERSPDLLIADILEQCAVLAEEVTAAGTTVSYVKPHGALYNRMAVDADVAASVVEAVANHPARVLVAQGGTVVVDLARRAGIRVVLEAYPDRGYLPSGRLAPRDQPGAVMADPAQVAKRALTLVERGGVEAVDGSWTPVEVETLCLHGDSPGAAEVARAVRSALEGAGLTLRPFTTVALEATDVNDQSTVDPP